jgi:hypothetical protein
MTSSSHAQSSRLRPLCLPALVQERTRMSMGLTSRSSMSALPVRTGSKSNIPSDLQVYYPFRLMHSRWLLPFVSIMKINYDQLLSFARRSFHLPSVRMNSPPSSPDPDSIALSPISQSPPDSPPPLTPHIGSGIVYFSSKNPAPLRPRS